MPNQPAHFQMQLHQYCSDLGKHNVFCKTTKSKFLESQYVDSPMFEHTVQYLIEHTTPADYLEIYCVSDKDGNPTVPYLDENGAPDIKNLWFNNDNAKFINTELDIRGFIVNANVPEYIDLSLIMRLKRMMNDGLKVGKFNEQHIKLLNPLALACRIDDIKKGEGDITPPVTPRGFAPDFSFWYGLEVFWTDHVDDIPEGWQDTTDKYLWFANKQGIVEKVDLEKSFNRCV